MILIFFSQERTGYGLGKFQSSEDMAKARGGEGGMGVSQFRRFYCTRWHHESCHCHGLHYDHDRTESNIDYATNPDAYTPCCQGRKGNNGANGDNGVNGGPGNPGPQGANGQDGVNGADA